MKEENINLSGGMFQAMSNEEEFLKKQKLMLKLLFKDDGVRAK
jgi:hypothetical protein